MTREAQPSRVILTLTLSEARGKGKDPLRFRPRVILSAAKDPSFLGTTAKS